jgi:precorrin-2 dehydrogenase/sirohydrochlorin ferrochelatase
MPFGYPVMLELAGRRCVVIGVDALREGKVEGLLAAGADDVAVVATGPAAHLEALDGLDGVTVSRRTWRAADLEGAFLVVAASSDADERRAIALEARARGALVNVMDDIPSCDWSAPAVVRRGKLVLAIATGGASPALARKLRERLSSEYGEEWSEVLAVLRSVREQTMPLLPDLATRARRWGEALDLDEAAALVRAGRSNELERRLRERLLGDANPATGMAETGEATR